MTSVLVVDDSPVDRKLAGRLLEKHTQFSISFAQHGVDALAQIEKQAPDLVVTDMHMPEMDGLLLVETIRLKHPLVPVVLMTAHGSEEIAVRALMCGAAGYVPKTELARDLVETVDNVLAIARADRSHQQLAGCVSRNEVRYDLENDRTLIPPLVDQVQKMIAGLKLVDETGRIRVAVAVEEALLNALYHGNLELGANPHRISDETKAAEAQRAETARREQSPYRDRRIHVHADVGREEARITVRDEGPGFDPSSIGDPADPAHLTQSKGRGLVLMRMFMDEVTYSSKGNTVTLVKRRD